MGNSKWYNCFSYWRLEDNGVYITSESMGYPTGGIVLKITEF